MNRTIEVTRNVNGEKQREKALLEWRDGDNLEHILHKLGLKLAMSAEGQKKYISTGLSYSELITHLTPELLKDSSISIRWLDQEAVCMEDKMLIPPYYNIFTVRGTAASRVFFRIVAQAVRMGEHWPDIHLQGLTRPFSSLSASLSFVAFDLCR